MKLPALGAPAAELRLAGRYGGPAGYDVHITRAAEWTDSEAAPITPEEWQSFVVTDPEMRLEDAATAPVGDGSVLAYRSLGLAFWLTCPGHGLRGNAAWFDYRRGRITVKNPDEEILSKMRQVARHFRARVVGDDGEEYP